MSQPEDNGQQELNLTYALEHGGAYSPKNYPGEIRIARAKKLCETLGREGEKEAFFNWDTDTITIYDHEARAVRELPLSHTLGSETK